MAKLQALKEFIALLNSHSVEYLIVGGHAVAFHGHPRFTGDIDFFIRMTPSNAQRLLAVLNDFGFGSVGITVRDLLEPKRILQLGQPPNRIDILTSISGVDFDSAWASRVESYRSSEIGVHSSVILSAGRVGVRERKNLEMRKIVAQAMFFVV